MCVSLSGIRYTVTHSSVQRHNGIEQYDATHTPTAYGSILIPVKQHITWQFYGVIWPPETPVSSLCAPTSPSTLHTTVYMYFTSLQYKALCP